jgi:hypothetical protein
MRGAATSLAGRMTADAWYDAWYVCCVPRSGWWSACQRLKNTLTLRHLNGLGVLDRRSRHGPTTLEVLDIVQHCGDFR